MITVVRFALATTPTGKRRPESVVQRRGCATVPLAILFGRSVMLPVCAAAMPPQGQAGMMGSGGRCAVALSKHEAGRGHFTYEDLLHTPDDGKRYEVLEGNLIVSPSPNRKHQRVLRHLFALLVQVEMTAGGQVYTAPFDVVLSDGNVVEPDLLFISQERLGIVTPDNVQGAPDLAVEIISEGSRKRDVITKRGIYERYGVRFYWLVDPEEETIRVFEVKDGAYGEPVTLKAGQQLACALFPGITQDVGELFAALY